MGYVIESGTVITGITLSLDYMNISSGGIASNTTLDDEGCMYISSGGVANSTVLSGWSATMYISSGGVANSTVLSGWDAAMYITNGGVANSTTVSGFGGFGGRMYIYSGGVASNTTVDDWGYMEISSGGVANSTTVNGYGRMYISSGGMANSTTVNSWGNMHIFSGGVANNTTVDGGWMYISSGGVANSTTVNSDGWMRISSGGVANSTTLNWGWMKIYSGGMANRTTVNSDGFMIISSGGVANSTAINSGGSMSISSGGVAKSTTVNSSGYMDISSGGVANSTTVSSGGYMVISRGGVHQGRLIIRNGAVVSAYSGGIIDFTLIGRTAEDASLINDISLITGTPTFTITVSASQGSGTYRLAKNAEDFTGTLTVGNGSVTYGVVTVNGDKLEYNGGSYQLTEFDGDLTLTIENQTGPISPDVPDTPDVPAVAEPVTPGATVEFDAESVTVDISVGDKVLNIADLTGKGVNIYAPRVEFGYSAGETTGNVNQQITDAESVLVEAENDEMLDLFMANATDVWSNEYVAKHTGTFDGWQGTGETVELAGKNKIADFFYGAEDDNILYLTDDSNGDALFVDDVYSAIPGSDLENTSRIENLKVIYAGSGNDIIDMTSQRFEYIGSEMSLHGGDGDDVIWATGSDNDLFGDAGDDRIVGSTGFDLIVGGSGNDTMHSGGGNDIFAFCENWGVDTVEITDNTTITLWFASGDKDNWDAENRIYKEGSNSVEVKGGANSKITLKFGDEGGQYDDMVSVGAFDSSTSAKIFEDKSNGYLA